MISYLIRGTYLKLSTAVIGYASSCGAYSVFWKVVRSACCVFDYLWRDTLLALLYARCCGCVACLGNMYTQSVVRCARLLCKGIGCQVPFEKGSVWCVCLISHTPSIKAQSISGFGHHRCLPCDIVSYDIRTSYIILCIYV